MARSLRWLIRTEAALVVLVFVPGLLSPFEAPKAALLRVVGLGLLVAIGLEAIAGRLRRSVAVSEQVADEDSIAPVHRSGSAMDLAVGLWLLAIALSTVFGVSPRLSLLGEIGQREGLLTTLALTGIYAGVRVSHRGVDDLRKTLDVIIACAALAAAYGLVQLAGFDPAGSIGAMRYETGGANVLRPASTLGNPILLGAFLTSVLGVAAARMALGRGFIWVQLPVLVLLAIANLATLSRGSWLAAAIAVGTGIAGSLLAGGRQAQRRAVLALAAVAIPTAIWAVATMRVVVLARVGEASLAGATSTPGRIEIARTALALWRDHPWFGNGPDTFGLMFPRFQTQAYWGIEWIGVPAHAHSALLQILATGGLACVIAGAVWLAMLATGIHTSWRQGGEGRVLAVETGAGLAGLVASGLLNVTGIAGATLFVTLSAMVACLAGRSVISRRSWGHSLQVAWMAGLLTAIVTAGLATRELGALADAGQARRLLISMALSPEMPRSGMAAAAAVHATAAAGIAPKEEELWRLCCDADLLLARDLLAARDSSAAMSSARAAKVAIGQALALEPTRASNFDRLGNVLGLLARLQSQTTRSAEVGAGWGATRTDLSVRADSAYAEAHRLAPYDANILVDQARAQLESHLEDRALLTARQLEAMYPRAAAGFAIEAAAQMMLGQRWETRRALERALEANWEPGSEPERQAAENMLRVLNADLGRR